jgi:DNA-binding CsgD family transcriptional regulator
MKMQKKGTNRSPNGGANSARSSLQKALETRCGRKLPKMMRRIAVRFASGETLEHIAGAETMTLATVEEVVRYAAWTLGCTPLSIDMAKPEKIIGAPEHRSGSAGELKSAQFLTEAKCEVCRKVIEEDSERVVVVPMELYYHQEIEDWGNHGIRPFFPTQPFHYCLDCARSTQEFRMPNPWFRTEQERRQLAKLLEEWKAQEKLKSDEQDKALSKDLAIGNLRAFNFAYSTAPKRDDVMSRAVPVSRLAAHIADQSEGGDPSSTGEITDQIFSGSAADEGWAKVAAAQSAGSGDAVQRAKVLEYLNSPQSKGKMLPGEREAARMWAAEGLSENEIARKQHVNQSTVHRRIDAARKKAHAARCGNALKIY